VVVLGEHTELLVEILGRLGHEVVARDPELAAIVRPTELEPADLALACVAGAGEEILERIDRVVRGSTCPVIVVVWATDPAAGREVAKRGVFDCVVNADPGELEPAVDTKLRQFTAYHRLHGAFGRRAAIEQARGILMASHPIDAQAAIAMLRDRAKRDGREIVDLAEALVGSHLLLVEREPRPPGD
jgi:AmiR/NasT family two-component response regulator